MAWLSENWQWVALVAFAPWLWALVPMVFAAALELFGAVTTVCGRLASIAYGPARSAQILVAGGLVAICLGFILAQALI